MTCFCCSLEVSARINLFPLHGDTRCESGIQSWPREYTQRDASFHIFQRQKQKHYSLPISVRVPNILSRNAASLPVALLMSYGLKKQRGQEDTHIACFLHPVFIKVCENINSNPEYILVISIQFPCVTATKGLLETAYFPTTRTNSDVI